MPTPEELERVKQIMLDRGYLKADESIDNKIAKVTKEMDRVIRIGMIREKLQELEQDSADRKALQDELLILEKERAAKVAMTGKEFVENLKLLAAQYQDFFQLQDLFKLYDWCIDGDYSLQDAFESVCMQRKTKIYLIRDLQENKIHGAFLRQKLAVHYCEQFIKNEVEVELIETLIADHKQPHQMAVYELDLRDGRYSPKASFWTFDIDAFTVYPVHLKMLKPGDEPMSLDKVERVKVVVIKQGGDAMLDKLSMEIRRAHKQAKLKFVPNLGNLNFYKLIVDPDA